MKYETKSGKVINYNFIENEDQLKALKPKNNYEKIIDYLLQKGETPRYVLNKEFNYFKLRSAEINRVLATMHIPMVISELDGIVSLRRSAPINSSIQYKYCYPNSNGKREKGADFSGPTSYHEIITKVDNEKKPVAKKLAAKKRTEIKVDEVKPVYIEVGSIVKFFQDWFNGASLDGSIKRGQRFRVNRYDERYFYIRRVNKNNTFAKNSSERKWSRTPFHGCLLNFSEIE